MTLFAYVDEAGDRGASGQSSREFVISAIIIAASDHPEVVEKHVALRKSLGMGPNDQIHFKRLKLYRRLLAAQSVNTMPLTITSVVVLKSHLSPVESFDADMQYLFAFRLLLERLSWFARDRNETLSYVLAHTKGIKLRKIREYEELLRTRYTEISWKHLDPSGGSLDQPKRLGYLQLADIVASGTYQAFRSDGPNGPERSYLEAISTRLYRRPPGLLTAYGLKLHPYSDTTKAAYPWVATL